MNLKLLQGHSTVRLFTSSDHRIFRLNIFLMSTPLPNSNKMAGEKNATCSCHSEHVAKRMRFCVVSYHLAYRCTPLLHPQSIHTFPKCHTWKHDKTGRQSHFQNSWRWSKIGWTRDPAAGGSRFQRQSPFDDTGLRHRCHPTSLRRPSPFRYCCELKLCHRVQKTWTSWVLKSISIQ